MMGIVFELHNLSNQHVMMTVEKGIEARVASACKYILEANV